MGRAPYPLFWPDAKGRLERARRDPVLNRGIVALIALARSSPEPAKRRFVRSFHQSEGRWFVTYHPSRRTENKWSMWSVLEALIGPARLDEEFPGARAG